MVHLPVPQDGRWVYVQHPKFPQYHDPPFLTRTQKRRMLRKKANQNKDLLVRRRFEGGSNKWIRKVDLTEPSHTDQIESRDGVESTGQNLDTDDDLSEFGNQVTRMDATTDGNTNDGYNKIEMDSTGQDDEDLMEDDEEGKAISPINLIDTTKSENLQTEALSPVSLFQYGDDPMTFFKTWYIPCLQTTPRMRTSQVNWMVMWMMILI